MPYVDMEIVDNHRQIDDYSCIPSSVELILKLIGYKPASYYALQEAWSNRNDGSFSDFDGQRIKGVQFKQRFHDHPRGDAFPLAQLYETIDTELTQGRFVIISLQSGRNQWHMYVIYDKSTDGDYLNVSKLDTHTITYQQISNQTVKAALSQMKGTDILTYSIG